MHLVCHIFQIYIIMETNIYKFSSKSLMYQISLGLRLSFLRVFFREFP